MPETPENDDAIVVSADDRRRAHEALDRWLDDAQRHAASTFETGRSGYIGRMKLWAFVDDNGVSLRIERSMLEDL